MPTHEPATGQLPAPPQPEQPEAANDTQQKQKKKRTWRRWLTGCLLLVVINLLATAVLLELAVRLIAPQQLIRNAAIWQPDSDIGWRRKPGLDVVINTGDRDVRFCTDERGDRTAADGDPPRPSPDAPGSSGSSDGSRVLILGDSFVEALAVPWPDTVWARTEAELGLRLEVAGVGGYGIPQYLQQLRERLAEVAATGDPASRYSAIVVNVYAGNDLTDNPERVPGPTQVQHKPWRLFPRGFNGQALRDWFFPYNQWLETWSHAYVAFRGAVRSVWPPEARLCLRRSKVTDRLIDGTSDGIAGMAAEARRHGIPMVVVLIPVPEQALDPELAALKKAVPDVADDLTPDLLQTRLVPRLREIDGVTVLDLLPGMLSHGVDPAWWGQRDNHLSPAGHGEWFRQLAPALREALGMQ